MIVIFRKYDYVPPLFVYLEYKVNGSLEDLEKGIFSSIGRKWKNLAETFGFSRTDIDSIKQDGNGHLEEEISQFFIRWRQKKGKDATAENLISAISRTESCKFVLDSLVKSNCLGEL